MSESIIPQQAAQEAQLAVQAACEAAAEARASAQEAREYIASHYLSEEITWTIDRTGDRSLLNLINLNIYEPINNIDYIPFNYIDNNIIYNDISPTIPFNNDHTQAVVVVCENIEISDEEQNCCICMEEQEKEEICSLNCNHKFCGVCVENCLKRCQEYTCSLCREPATKITTQKLEIKEKLDVYCL
jgi:hypothetical protein